MSLNSTTFHSSGLEIFINVEVGRALKVMCVISGFGRDVHEIWDFTQRQVVDPISTFRTNRSDHHQGSASSGNSMPRCRNLSVEMGLIGCPETAVRNYHAMPRYIPDKSGFQVHCSFCYSFEFVSNTLVYY